ncbi:hypothetical protein BUALT_Bualt02G0076700 [Buddleja alternifolia]|uniref:Protein MIS12 homolog n=1 Tax=Buddleja alternifolia TaxID=168488 RepID=A0AAV6Y4N2_9LAMI|nr:hypothetical protein BUALT_Bualt02G0076700 [Buddleja alternifolia]
MGWGNFKRKEKKGKEMEMEMEMEGGGSGSKKREREEAEAIFEWLDLSPKLFINEVLNIVDDLLHDAFNFFIQEASSVLLKTDRSPELNKGVAYIRDLIQSTLDQRMEKWEEYCLRFCFHVPEAFSLPKPNESFGEDIPDTGTELDAKLKLLRDELTLVGKESAELGRELHALERQSLSSNQSAGSIDEALQLYKKHDATQMFQELTTMASEFRSKLGNLKRRRMEEIQCDRAERLHLVLGDALRMHRGNGLFNAKLEELEEFLDEINTS